MHNLASSINRVNLPQIICAPNPSNAKQYGLSIRQWCRFQPSGLTSKDVQPSTSKCSTSTQLFNAKSNPTAGPSTVHTKCYEPSSYDERVNPTATIPTAIYPPNTNWLCVASF